ncbi:hypothetical protein [Paenibacillus sp. FSL L8-0708]|uniref:hypothetical protein n=1 Tax=Paenibacillus sp. FSL L8-0708 TaxID=2975311 RepID=UPI0030F54C2E
MSDPGKVSLPEIDYTRLKSIKDKHLRMDKEIFWNELEVKPESLHGDRACLLGIIDYYMAALEESQQQVNDLKEDKRKIFAVHDEQCARSSEYYNELIFVKGKLAEAQQTIARQREALEFYANQEHWELPSFGRGQSKVTSDKGSKAREFLEEGSNKA